MKGLKLLMSILFASVVLRVVVLFVNEGIFQLYFFNHILVALAFIEFVIHSVSPTLP